MRTVKKIGESYMRRSLLALLGLMVGLSLAPAANAQIGTTPWIGEIMAVPFNFAPKGWALCAGQILPINQNTALFSLLGTTYGGNGTTNFALPDLRGRTPVSSGQGPGLSSYDLGGTGGVEQVTLTISQLPPHSHQAFGSTNVATTAAPAGDTWATQTRADLFSSSGGTAMAPQALALAPTGGAQPHENRSPYLVMNYVIALQGIFPSRT